MTAPLTRADVRAEIASALRDVAAVTGMARVLVANNDLRAVADKLEAPAAAPAGAYVTIEGVKRIRDAADACVAPPDPDAYLAREHTTPLAAEADRQWMPNVIACEDCNQEIGNTTAHRDAHEDRCPGAPEQAACAHEHSDLVWKCHDCGREDKPDFACKVENIFALPQCAEPGWAHEYEDGRCRYCRTPEPEPQACAGFTCYWPPAPCLTDHSSAYRCVRPGCGRRRDDPCHAPKEDAPQASTTEWNGDGESSPLTPLMGPAKEADTPNTSSNERDVGNVANPLGGPHEGASASPPPVVEIPSAIEALCGLLDVIDAAGLLNLANGVQLGPTVWYVKASERCDAARAVLARYPARPANAPVSFARDFDAPPDVPAAQPASGLHFRCAKCDAPINKPGALLFGPPDSLAPSGPVTKTHVCSDCYATLLLGTQPASTEPLEGPDLRLVYTYKGVFVVPLVDATCWRDIAKREHAAWRTCDEERRLMLLRAERAESVYRAAVDAALMARERAETAERDLAQWVEAVGLLSTLAGEMPIDVEHPVAMAQEIVDTVARGAQREREHAKKAEAALTLVRNELTLVKRERAQAWRDRDAARAEAQRRYAPEQVAFFRGVDATCALVRTAKPAPCPWEKP